MVTKDKISVDPSKNEVVVNLQRPTNVIKVRSFMGLTCYYRWFVEGFFNLASTDKKDVKFQLDEECEKGF